MFDFKSFHALRKHLRYTHLFDDAEIQEIVRCCGSATIGAVVNVCECLGFGLYARDVDCLYHTEMLDELIDDMDNNNL